MNTNKTYSSSDIQRYIGGQMPAEEMNALEKAAMEDPFLSDAIEGYIGNTTERKTSVHEDMEDLSNRLKVRLGEGHIQVAVPLFKWWKAAAVIVLLAGAGVLVYTLTNTTQHNQTLAKNEAPVTVPPSLQDTLAGNIISLNEPAAGIMEKIADQQAAPVPINNQPSVNKIAGKKTVENSRMITSEKRTLRSPKPVQDQYTKDVEQESLKEQIAAVSVQQTAASSVAEKASHTFRGKIVDEYNKPVPNATVLVINSQLGVSADSGGRFDFSFNDSLATVNINSAGFEPAQATLKTGLINTEIKLQRHSDTNSEVIPLATGRAKNAVPPVKSITSTNADIYPVNGWIEYNMYIEKNKRMPAAREGLQEEIVLSFVIDNNGRPAQIEIEKPASSAVNAEAIRLLKEGAAWKNNQQTRAVVNIRL